MFLELCVCELAPKFHLKTKFSLIMQSREYHLASNTGHWIPKIFPGSEIRFRGLKDHQPVSTENLISNDHFPVILFPSGNAQILSKDLVENLGKPLQIIVPDGNWGQTTKMVRKIPLLQNSLKVKLPDMGPSQYRLRRGQREGGVCTYEAIAKAIGILEGPEIEKQLMIFFQTFVERILFTRSKIKRRDVFGGIPDTL